MKDIECIEILCKMQDLNKGFRLKAENEDESHFCDIIDDIIQDQFNTLNVN